MSNTTLSIVILNSNCLNFIKECLNSFERYPPQTDYEIIIVNNDDNHQDFNNFSDHYPSIKFVQNTGNWGFSHGCNLGADNAIGDYLLFLNPDIQLTSSPAIDTMINFAQKNPNVGITSCRKINPKGNPEREISFLSPWLTIGWLRALYRLIFKQKISEKFSKDNDIWYPDWISGSVVVIEKIFFIQIRKWSQKHFWMYSEDPDLCKKARNQRKEIALLRNVELKHAHGGASRRNPKTVAITKSEVVTSSHVFVQIHAKGLNRAALHFIIIVNTLVSWLLRVLFTLPIFWKIAFKENLFTLNAVIRYYLNAPIRKTWKSKRLNG